MEEKDKKQVSCPGCGHILDNPGDSQQYFNCPFCGTTIMNPYHISTLDKIHRTGMSILWFGFFIMFIQAIIKSCGH